ncbi:hypothetical protein CORC01_12644 [Colletotrichum orchidophilum]|uniref:C2H2-type domain-containing protein n=1 Tax=Colletotrichum orchidophilum TaxID=1209926 RepID=A0A1G4ASK2_9PEZI|nr:uncharacterized protein CORC01_12644 [Colletotrichum orchidophilum]OHE92063.1 hypothetical protein CORC01_12644 [Colletotrichum orchidophilum]
MGSASFRSASRHCHWKDCQFSTSNSETYEEHMLLHRRCPKDGCLSEFKEEKDIQRHVWKTHRRWAFSTKYPSIRGVCGICGKIYERKDYVRRHMREKHQDQNNKVRQQRPRRNRLLWKQ